MGLDIYAEALVENYEHPMNKGVMRDATVSMHEENTTCGDDITVYLKIEGDKIADVKFDGRGCVISMGTASILTDYMKGKTLKDLRLFGKEQLLSLINIDPGPVRLHCATLSLRAMRRAMLEHMNEKLDDQTKEL